MNWTGMKVRRSGRGRFSGLNFPGLNFLGCVAFGGVQRKASVGDTPAVHELPHPRLLQIHQVP